MFKIYKSSLSGALYSITSQSNLDTARFLAKGADFTIDPPEAVENEFQTAFLIDPKMISFLGILSELIHIYTNIFFWGHNMERILLWPFSYFGR